LIDALSETLGAPFCNASGNCEGDPLGPFAGFTNNRNMGGHDLARSLNVRWDKMHFHRPNMHWEWSILKLADRLM
jgi:hypothetical protein